MMFSGLIIAALAAAADKPVPPHSAGLPDIDWVQECQPYSGEPQDVDTWAIVDARSLSSPEELARAIEAAPKDRRLIVRGGEFAGGDMRPLAPLLAGACFYETNLEATNWEGSAVEGLQFERATLASLRASEVFWPGLRARGVDLNSASFQSAYLADMQLVARYRGLDLRDANFRQAELRGASFHCGITIDVNCWDTPDFGASSLQGADLSSLGIWDEDKFGGALLDNTRVSPQSMLYLGNAAIRGPLFLTHYAASPYLEDDSPPGPIVEVSAEEARLLIDAANREIAEREPGDPSFACEKASTNVEKTICGPYDGHLRDLDLRLSALWGEVRAAGKARLAEQRAWLRERNRCDDRLCIEKAYDDRIAQLTAVIGQDLILAPDQSIEFHGETLPLPDEARGWDVYERILPVLRDASRQTITLTGMEDGSVRAEGMAIGANAHTCSLDIPAATFDPQTGWGSAQGQGGSRVKLFYTTGRRIELRYSGNMGDTPLDAIDFISCGARAGFDTGWNLSPTITP